MGRKKHPGLLISKFKDGVKLILKTKNYFCSIYPSAGAEVDAHRLWNGKYDLWCKRNWRPASDQAGVHSNPQKLFMDMMWNSSNKYLCQYASLPCLHPFLSVLAPRSSTEIFHANGPRTQFMSSFSPLHRCALFLICLLDSLVQCLFQMLGLATKGYALKHNKSCTSLKLLMPYESAWLDSQWHMDEDANNNKISLASKWVSVRQCTECRA